MRLALAPINPTVGDIAGNAALITGWIERARDDHADFVAFPELALTGYPPKDLLLQEGFMAAVAAAAKQIGERHTEGITVVFGTPLPLRGQDGGPTGASDAWGLANSLLAYRDGRMLDYYDKRLLPTYDVFDEDRYFEPGARPVVIEAAGARIGLSICEDLWRGEDVGFSHKYLDCADPVAELVEPSGVGRAGGAQLIINPSASPFVLGKGRRHRELLRRHAMRHGVWVAAVNQLGGNDELIFDGSAVVIAPDGSVVGANDPFRENLLVVEAPAAHDGAADGGSDPRPAHDPFLELAEEELAYRALVLGVRDYLRKTGFRNAVIGLSGGIDSAVTAVIAAAALGPENVTGVAMPSRYSSPGSVRDAEELAANLGLPFHLTPIEPAFNAFERALAEPFAGRGRGEADVAEENVQARCRGVILMAFANKFNSLLLTTGNKSELAVGYCTLYGDMNGGLAVLSDVDKGLVYRLARWMNASPARLGFERPLRGGPIPESTITKPPSAELRANQLDQDSLPPYDVLDEIIERYVEGRQSPGRIVRETGFEVETVKRIVRLIDVNEYKRKQAAIGLKLTGVAFGSGRRMPIAQGWRPEREL